MSKLKDKNPEIANEYIIRETYRNLIRSKLEIDPHANVQGLRKRLFKLEKEKWGELTPGIPKRRNIR